MGKDVSDICKTIDIVKAYLYAVIYYGLLCCWLLGLVIGSGSVHALARFSGFESTELVVKYEGSIQMNMSS